jgi:2-methylcitrate dehydratase
VRHTILKRYNAEIHSQSAIEAALELKHKYGFSPDDIKWVEIDIFKVAYDIIGGGEEGDKTIVRTKEEADHSLPYMVAVALLDDEVLPAQYELDRIQRQDVQLLLRKVVVRPSETYSSVFPEQHACKVEITLDSGRRFAKEKADYEGFHTNPMSWETVRAKFEGLSAPYTDADLRTALVDTVANLEQASVAQLVDLLRRVRKPQ